MSKDIDKQLEELGREVRRALDVKVRRSDGQDPVFEKLMQAISCNSEITPATAWDYYRWLMGELVVTPVAVGAMLMVLVFGGWMTTVSAADSLPGEALYSVKLATEKAQLRLASLEHKAVLHTEFAERRLEEAAALKATDSVSNQDYIKEAMAAYKQQVEQAGADLQRLQNEGSADTVAIASQIDQKITELNSTIENSVSEAESEMQEVVEAQLASEEVSNSAVNVMVDEHENSNATSLNDLSSTFRTKVTDVRHRQAYALGRLAVIERVIESNENLETQGINELIFSANEVTDFVAEAMNLAAVGGYRAAFDNLKTANNRLAAVEQRIVDLEILITTQSLTKNTEALDVTNVPEAETIPVEESNTGEESG